MRREEQVEVRMSKHEHTISLDDLARENHLPGAEGHEHAGPDRFETIVKAVLGNEGQVIVGAPGADSLTGHPGDAVFGGAGNDTITLEAELFTGPVHPRAFAFGGPGDDTIINNSFFRENLAFDVTAFGGPGNDTFIGPTNSGPGTTFYTGGPGHDLFVFGQGPFTGVTLTITDFSRADAIRLDGLDYMISLGQTPDIQITDHGSFTEIFTQGPANRLDLTLNGHFDPAKFHVTNDGHDHVFITYGHGPDWFLS
jgi:hypothetical protein